MKDFDQAALELASKGEAVVARVAAIAERAHQLLGSVEFESAAASPQMLYAWQALELFEVCTPRNIYIASVDDFATGEGLTISFFAGLAPSGNAFRRSIAGEVGASLADRATIGKASDAKVTFRDLFLSPALQARLRRIEHGEDDPGAFSFFARVHANYS